MSASPCTLGFGNSSDLVSRFIALSIQELLPAAILDGSPSAGFGGRGASTTCLVLSGLSRGVFDCFEDEDRVTDGKRLISQEVARLMAIPKMERGRNSYLDERSLCAEVLPHRASISASERGGAPQAFLYRAESTSNAMLF